MIDKLVAASPDRVDGRLNVASKRTELPMDVWTVDQINRRADRCLTDTDGYDEFGGNYRGAIECWRRTMAEHVLGGDVDDGLVELLGVSVGDVVLVGVSAEIFSQFTEIVRSRTGRTVYTVSCANGLFGYVPTAAAYDEGDYEAETAMLFYNSFRPQRGGLELLAEEAGRLVARLHEECTHCRDQSATKRGASP